jgi:hypothetical protein
LFNSSRDFSLIFDVKVQPHVYRNTPLDPILTQIKPLYILTLIPLRFVLILFHVKIRLIISSLASRSLQTKFCFFFRFPCTLHDISSTKYKDLGGVHTNYRGARGGVVVKALRYKPAGRGFDSRRCHWNFSVTKSFRSHYGPGIDSASNRNK